MTTSQVARLLADGLTFRGDEAQLQRDIATLLDAIPGFKREARLGVRERIDFLLTREGLGIEVKVDGATSALRRQLGRYAQSDRIREMLVVTTRTRLAQLPEWIGGKRIRVLVLIGSAL